MDLLQSVPVLWSQFYTQRFQRQAVSFVQFKVLLFHLLGMFTQMQISGSDPACNSHLYWLIQLIYCRIYRLSQLLISLTAGYKHPKGFSQVSWIHFMVVKKSEYAIMSSSMIAHPNSQAFPICFEFYIYRTNWRIEAKVFGCVRFVKIFSC